MQDVLEYFVENLTEAMQHKFRVDEVLILMEKK